MYLNFNVLNNEVFEWGSDSKMVAVLERCIERNKELADTGKQPYVGFHYVPDNWWSWSDGAMEQGLDILIQRGD